MNNFQEIKKFIKRGDYEEVAKIIGKSPSLVKSVINDQRADRHNIKQIFIDLVKSREEQRKNLQLKHAAYASQKDK